MNKLKEPKNEPPVLSFSHKICNISTKSIWNSCDPSKIAPAVTTRSRAMLWAQLLISLPRTRPHELGCLSRLRSSAIRDSARSRSGLFPGGLSKKKAAQFSPRHLSKVFLTEPLSMREPSFKGLDRIAKHLHGICSAAGVAPLVVIPRTDFDHPSTHHHGEFGIVDRAVRIAHDVLKNERQV